MAVLIFIATIVVVGNFFAPRTSLGGVNQYLEVFEGDIFRQSVGQLDSDVMQHIPQNTPRNYRYQTELRVDQLLYLLLLDNYTTEAKNVFDELASYVPEQYGVSYSVNDASLTNSSFYRPSSRVELSDARTKLSARTITLLPSKYCVSACFVKVTEVSVWS